MRDCFAATVTYSIVGIVTNCRFNVDVLNCVGLLSGLDGLSLWSCVKSQCEELRKSWLRTGKLQMNRR